MRRLPVPQSSDFLLDENVSINLKKLLILKEYNVETVQELNKRGIKNSELLKLASASRRILITYDKDFLNFKIEPEHFIILIDIHPLTDENVLPVFEKFLKNFSTLFKLIFHFHIEI